LDYCESCPGEEHKRHNVKYYPHLILKNQNETKVWRKKIYLTAKKWLGRCRV